MWHLITWLAIPTGELWGSRCPIKKGDAWLVLVLDNLEKGHGALEQPLHLTRMEEGVFGTPPLPAGSLSLKEEKYLVLKRRRGKAQMAGGRLLRSRPGAHPQPKEEKASVRLSLAAARRALGVLDKQK